MKLPTRPSTYILSALLLLLAVLVYYLSVTINHPALQRAIEEKKPRATAHPATLPATIAAPKEAIQ